MAIKLDFSNCVDNSIMPIAQRISQTIISIWDITFGWIDNYDQKLSMKRNQQLQLFANTLEHKINSIPQENLIEPRLSIVGPAFESSKYYFEEPELREMFANLIAASINKEYSNKIRSSYTEIIKQLEPLDAKLLSYIKEKGEKLPICDYRKKYDESLNYGYITLFSNIFENQEQLGSYESITCSLSNLIRLGILEVPYGTLFADESQYNWSESSIFHFQSLSLIKQSEILEQTKLELEIQNKQLLITPLGKDFISVCLN